MVGVYLLKLDDTVVYVGQSINVLRRLKDHAREKIKEYNNEVVVECSKENLNATEESYILLFSPKYNIKRAEIKSYSKPAVYILKKERKNIKVDKATHTQAKAQADREGMTLGKYIQKLLNTNELY